MNGKKASSGLSLLVVLGAFTTLLGGVAGDNANNDSFANAELITPGDYSGELNLAGGPDDQEDYYKFAVAEGQWFGVTGTGGVGAEVRFHVANPDQDEILTSDWLATGNSETLQYTLGHANSGTYYVWAEMTASDGRANYTFNLDVLDQEDAGQTGDAGDTDSTARAVTPGTYDGWLEDEDVDDYYSFGVPHGNKINLAFTTSSENPTGGSLRLELYRPDKNSLNGTDWANPGLGKTLIHQTSDTTGGTYYAKMTYSGEGGEYKLTLALEPQDDAGSGTDAAGGINTDPYLLPGNGTYSGYLLDDDETDFYRFNVSAGQIITSNLTCGLAEPEPVRFVMYRPDKNEYQSSDWLNPGVSQELSWIANNAGAGVWHLKAEGPNSYTFELALVDQMDANVPGDAGDAIASPRPVQLDEHYTGLLGDDDEQDHYSFEGVAGSTVMVNFSFYSGTEQGRVHLYGPDKNGTTVNTTTVNLTGTASDNVGVVKVEVSLDGATVPTTFLLGAWVATNVSLKEGKNTIVVTATDAAGNTGTQTMTVTYEKPKPQPGFEPLLLVAAIGAGFALVARRRK
ncbi:MAG: hypothetical protein FJ149_01435 [Euryarchaeota archaeon]|nr:hypothetical protein [Euryarchaeota archaeon]